MIWTFWKVSRMVVYLIFRSVPYIPDDLYDMLNIWSKIRIFRISLSEYFVRLLSGETILSIISIINGMCLSGISHNCILINNVRQLQDLLWNVRHPNSLILKLWNKSMDDSLSNSEYIAVHTIRHKNKVIINWMYTRA